MYCVQYCDTALCKQGTRKDYKGKQQEMEAESSGEDSGISLCYHFIFCYSGIPYLGCKGSIRSLKETAIGDSNGEDVKESATSDSYGQNHYQLS